METYRAKSVGAFSESYHKFVLACDVINKYTKQDVRILDLCFGLGYNCAVTYEYASRVCSPYKLHIVSIEKDHTLPALVKNSNLFWPKIGYKILRECLVNSRVTTFSNSFSLELHLLDAISAVDLLKGTFDVIYFDPFSYSKNPEMWSVDFFRKIYNLLSEKDGRLSTYASAKKIRENMIKSGFRLKETPSVGTGIYHPGTIAFR